MNRYEAIRASDDYPELLAVSERLGRSPLQVQGPGGNTSLKRDGAMWVKASGTWLADARQRDIMVPVDAASMRRALVDADPAARDANAFRVGDRGTGRRASIETSVHAMLDWPVVLHTHCVSTIAIAVTLDAERAVSERLDGVDVAFIPYVKPGFDLARAIGARITPRTQVLVLGNHGLVVCGNSPAEAESLLVEVSARLAGPTPPAGEMSPAFLRWLAPTGWQAVDNPATQALVHDRQRLALVPGNALYPDHAVFLGPGVAVADRDEPPDEAAARAAFAGVRPKLVMYPEGGAAVPGDASAAAVELARCLAEVVMRVAPDSALRRLGDEEQMAILDWDAEKHRRAMDAQAR